MSKKTKKLAPTVFDRITEFLLFLQEEGIEDTSDISIAIYDGLPPQEIYVIPYAKWDCPSCNAPNESSMHYDDDGENECRSCGLKVELRQP